MNKVNGTYTEEKPLKRGDLSLVKVLPMEEGDLVYVEYDVWILPEEEDGEEILFDTTDEEKAKENDIHDEDAFYGSKPILLGEEEVMEGFEDDLMGSEVGEERSVEVPPEKGMGQREAEEIELFSRRQLDRKGIDPVEGKRVEIDNRKGRIIQATAGRVRIDFNHPLSGKTLRYDYKVTDKPEDIEDKIKAVLVKDYGEDVFDISLKEDAVEIILPDECKYNQGWFISKYRVIGDLRKQVDTETIRLIEEYEGKEEEEELDELEEEVEKEMEVEGENSSQDEDEEEKEEG